MVNSKEEFDLFVKELDLDVSNKELKHFYASMFGVSAEGNINWPAIIDTGECYTDPGSFCSRCGNVVHKDRYCTECGLRNKHYDDK